MAMNILEKNFAPSEAQLKYLDADFVVLKPGTFVRCALTGAPIALDDLAYWSVDRQEPYANAEVATQAYAKARGR